MSETQRSASRRDALKLMVGTVVAVPVIGLGGVGLALAEPANAVTANDPIAVTLKYSADATLADRAGNPRPGKPPAEQFCRNCMFRLPDPAVEGYSGCSLMPGKMVNNNGWCASWTMRSAVEPAIQSQ